MQPLKLPAVPEGRHQDDGRQAEDVSLQAGVAPELQPVVFQKPGLPHQGELVQLGKRIQSVGLLVLLPLTLGQSSAGGCGATGPAPDPDPDDTAVDSDGDGFSDFDEVNFTPGTDPNDPTDNPDNVRDTDADGCSDYDETNFDGFCNNDPYVPGLTTRDVQNATWLVVAVSDYSLTTATAFGIGPRLLGTSAHVVESIMATWAEPNGTAGVFQHETGEMRLVTTVWWHPDYDPGSATVTPDVGILEVDSNLPSFLTVPDTADYPTVEVFEPVGLCGFPGSVTFGVDFAALGTGEFHPRATCLDGSVSAIRPFDPGESLTTANGQLIQYDISTEPGVSGRAVFNAYGEIVGVHALGVGASSEQNFAIRIDKLAELLAGISDGAAAGRTVPPGSNSVYLKRR